LDDGLTRACAPSAPLPSVDACGRQQVVGGAVAAHLAWTAVPARDSLIMATTVYQMVYC
jgi:hypothetical protein